jgi:hypothetical protein
LFHQYTTNIASPQWHHILQYQVCSVGSIAKFTDKFQGNVRLSGWKVAIDHGFDKKMPETDKQLGQQGF